MLNQVIHADCLTGLPQIPAGLVQCVVTSPPYWRLRQYHGVAPTTWSDGQAVCLGAEADPDSFVRHLVEVFAGVWRVLRDDGVLFVNLGETYSNNGGKRKAGSTAQDGNTIANVVEDRGTRNVAEGLNDGDRCGIPERFALAMQADGWVWRDTIIWVKRSPMPASRSGWRWQRCRVKAGASERANGHKADAIPHKPHGGYAEDGKSFAPGAVWSPCPGCKKCLPNDGWVLRKGRFATTQACEPIFMFTKGGEYFCDSEACKTPHTQGTLERFGKNNAMHSAGPKARDLKPSEGMANADYKRHLTQGIVGGALPRSYMLLSAEPTKKKHFAAYPSEIPRRLIEMATSKGGCCPKCRSPYAPVVESERVPTRPGTGSKVYDELPVHPESPVREHSGIVCGNRDPERHVARTNILGYRASCTCNAGEPIPCVVFDPFLGTGTTARAAYHLGRDWLGIEASADYLPIIAENILRPLPSKDQTKPKPKRTPKPRPENLLF